MKDSGLPWIGTIPSNWRCLRGKFVLHYLQKPTREDDGVITCFRDGEVTLRSNRREEGFTISEKEIGYQGIDVGDLVVHGMDGFAGAIGISDSRGKASPVLVVLDSAENKRFLMYYLRNLAYRDVFLALATGIRVRSCDLRWNKIADTVFTLPHIDEQNVIVTFIDNKLLEIDTAIKEAHELIDKYKAYKQSVITEAVTKGLDPQVPMKNSGLAWANMIPHHWDVMPNKYIMYKLREIQDVYTGEDIISLSTDGVKVRDLDAGGKMPTTFNGYQRIKPGRLLMCLFDMDVTPRCIGLIKDEGLTSQAYSQFVLREKGYAPYYYYYYLCLDFDKTLVHLAKNLRHSLTEDQLGAINVPVPPLEEQQIIADYLDDKCSQIDSIIREKENLISRLQEYKKSIIFEYVTGKKEVPNG